MREFKITYKLKNPNSVSMYIEQWTYYRVREQSVCNIAHSEGVIITYRLKKQSSASMYVKQWTYYRGKRTISV